MAAKKKKLKITCCEVNKAGQVKPSSPNFQVLVNPSEFSHNLGIAYSSDGDNKTSNGKSVPQGKSAINPKFSHYEQEKLKFDLVIDGTGAIPGSKPKQTYVADEVKKLRDVVFQYSGEKHKPRVVQITWGGFLFVGQLNSMGIKYTLFAPSGVPLRAKVNLDFGEYTTNAQESKKAKRESPDLTHFVWVKAGDTLPALCQQVYNDDSYYPEVARFNQLQHFRDLKPGTQLHFPPLE